ncbi:MAG: hypothetical protein COW30_06795 [Rhodospirillales bacterium CG15_BIG_FIL_POST_REV_8_21_14_020_66_15]|nr:MAG: hypothetical protein COW30_06795 [Rhodospirillales bacterium CG15_BIG_FIL_POST_REV_8_21_14_020_66_15]
MVIFAAILPSLGVASGALWAYPILWETGGGILFFLAIATLVFAVFRPAKPASVNLERFAYGAVDFLAHATDKDRAEFSTDLRFCIYDMVRKADLRQRLWSPSAFVLFTKRKELRESDFASAFLRVLSDPAFCQVLVRDTPWNTALILQEIEKYFGECESITEFVREIARQSILMDDSMFAREIEYKGFRETSVISETLFGNHHIARFYTPLNGVWFGDTADLEVGQIKRVSRALLLTVKSLLLARSYWPQHGLHGASDLVSSVARDICQRVRNNRADYRLVHALEFDLFQMVDKTRKHLGELDDGVYARLFFKPKDDAEKDMVRDFTLLDEIAEVVVDYAFSFCNDFEGGEDSFWSSAISINRHVFDQFGGNEAGFDPLQQRVALKILRKVDENLEGWYPAISRMFLSTIGFYEPPKEEDKNKPWELFVHAFFYRFQAFPEFYDKDRDKAETYLPNDVRYDPKRRSIIKTYLGGDEQETALSGLDLPEININDHLRSKSAGDGDAEKDNG